VARSPAVAGGALRVEVADASLHCRDGPPFGASRVLAYVPLDIAPLVARGDEVTATATLAPPYRFWNDGTGDPRPAAARRGAVLSGGAEDLVIGRESYGVRGAVEMD